MKTSHFTKFIAIFTVVLYYFLSTNTTLTAETPGHEISKATSDTIQKSCFSIYKFEIDKSTFKRPYNINNTLLFIYVENDNLTIDQLQKGRLTKKTIFPLSLPNSIIGNISHGKDPKHITFLIFNDKLISTYEYNTESEFVRKLSEFNSTLELYLFSFIPNYDMFIISGRLCKLLISYDGEIIQPEPNEIMTYYNSCGANEKSFALNIDFGLTIYELTKQPKRIWNQDRELGGISEIASVGNSWIATVVNAQRPGKHALRFNPIIGIYHHEIIDLPPSQFWRITDHGEFAVIWADDSAYIKIIGKSYTKSLTLPDEFSKMEICPGHLSSTIFFIGEDQYGVLDITKVPNDP